MVPTSWQDEALARDGVSGELPCSALKGETVPDSLPVQTAKASRKQSSLSGKESAQGCTPKRLLGRPDEALGGGNQGPSAPGWGRQHHSQRDPPFVPILPGEFLDRRDWWAQSMGSLSREMRMAGSTSSLGEVQMPHFSHQNI